MAEPTPEIADVLAGWDETVRTSARVSKRARRLSRIVAASLVFDVVFTLGLGYVTHQLQQTQQFRCLASNDFKRQDQARWLYIIGLTAKPGETPQQQAATRGFKAYIVRTDAPAKCS